MANVLFAKQLAKNLEGTNKTANAVHPGVIQTNLGRHMPSWMNLMFAPTGLLFAKSVPQGAATQCYVATNPSLADVSGRYFYDCNIQTERADGSDMATAERLWQVSEEIVAGV